MSDQPAARAASARRASTRRKDPQSRDARGLVFGGLLNHDPNRKYVRVPKSGRFGVEYYEFLGYEIETKREGGPRFAGIKTAQDGEPVSYLDTVLMSMSLEQWQELDQHGHDGSRGQAYADIIEERILDKTRLAFDDPSRGIFRSYPTLKVEKSVTPLRPQSGQFESFGDESADSME
jgi:hypothetical protein